MIGIMDNTELEMCKVYNAYYNKGYEKGREDERPKAFSNGYEAGYQQGRSDKEKEIKEKSVFYSNKPIEQIALEARADAIEEFRKIMKEYFIVITYRKKVDEVAEKLLKEWKQ